MPRKAVDGVERNLPYPEEAEDVVDAVCVEIFRHLSETLFPPAESVGRHSFPVVGWEAPVLTQHGKVVGRRAGLRVHVEQAGILPRVNAFAPYADGNVSFEDDSVLMGEIAHFAQLPVEVELLEKKNPVSSALSVQKRRMASSS